MLLRSITQHLKNQNWFAVLLDLFIVVLGVFIGIQVSNWNAERNNLQRADAFIVRLNENITSDLYSLSMRIKFNAQVIKYGEQALAYAEGNEETRVANWPVVLAFFQASQVFPYYQNNTTYDELRSTGELSLIREQSLRAKLADYYVTGTGGVTEDYIFRHVPDYRTTIRGLMPSTITKYVWANCHQDEGVGYQTLLACDFTMSENRARAILNSFVTDPTMLRELRFWMSTLDTIQSLLRTNQSLAKDLAQQTEANISQ